MTQDSPRIMVVSADTALGLKLLTAFDGSGYRTVTVSGRNQIEWLLERDGLPDVMIIDLDPTRPFHQTEFDKLTFLTSTSALPILLIGTPADSERLATAAQSLNADFMYKPVVELDVSVRVQRLLASAPDRRGQRLSYTLNGEVVGDFHNRIVTHGRDMVVLSALENRLLYMLVQDAPEAVLSERLAGGLWGDEYQHEHKLRSLVRRLRQKLDPVLGANSIETVTAVGYRFARPATAVVQERNAYTPGWD